MAVAHYGAAIPRTVPMTNEQYRAHRNLGRADKRLVYLLNWSADPREIAKAQQVVNKWHAAWRRSCEKAALSHRETGGQR